MTFGSDSHIDTPDNTLNEYSVPQNNSGFDFFNYAGIHRSVHLYTTPRIYIADVVLDSQIGPVEKGTTKNSTVLMYRVEVAGLTATDKVQCQVTVLDRNRTVVGTGMAPVNEPHQLQLKKVSLWWPYLMSPDPGYLYTLEFRLIIGREVDCDGDMYRMKYGFRSLAWSSTQMLINDRPIYFRGFGRHEDSDVSMSLFLALIIIITNSDLMAVSRRFVVKDLILRCSLRISICWNGRARMPTGRPIIPIPRNRCSSPTRRAS